MENRITLNMTEAARMMGVSVPVMRELANQPGFPAFRAGRRWIIPRDLLKLWIEDQARNEQHGA